MSPREAQGGRARPDARPTRDAVLMVKDQRVAGPRSPVARGRAVGTASRQFV
jgi:hypothetical protein